ncbi:MAG: lysylphosphatidylglycerol synthase transmembrane domain-containing protein, partial [Actinomycetes bacterium]
EDVLQRLFEQTATRLGEVLGDRRRIGRATLWASLNWLLDAASLWVFVGAFGHWVNPDGLLVAYGLANVLAAIPLTPGGLGVVEATLTSALVGFNTTRAVALLGVVAYRLVNFWIPIPVGGLAYLSLQIDPGGHHRPQTVP